MPAGIRRSPHRARCRARGSTPRMRVPFGAPRSDLGARVLVALPAIALALFLVIEGGSIFTLGLFALGCLCMHELYGMYDARAPRAPGGLPRARGAARGGAVRRPVPDPARRRRGAAGAVRVHAAAAQAERGRDGGHAAGHLLDRLRARPRRAPARSAPRPGDRHRRARRAPSSATPAPTSAGACSAAARSRRDLAEQDRRGPA